MVIHTEQWDVWEQRRESEQQEDLNKSKGKSIFPRKLESATMDEKENFPIQLI